MLGEVVLRGLPVKPRIRFSAYSRGAPRGCAVPGLMGVRNCSPGSSGVTLASHVLIHFFPAFSVQGVTFRTFVGRFTVFYRVRR